MVELEEELRLGLLADKRSNLLDPIPRLVQSAADIGGSKQAYQQQVTLGASSCARRYTRSVSGAAHPLVIISTGPSVVCKPSSRWSRSGLSGSRISSSSAAVKALIASVYAER